MEWRPLQGEEKRTSQPVKEYVRNDKITFAEVLDMIRDKLSRELVTLLRYVRGWSRMQNSREPIDIECDAGGWIDAAMILRFCS